MGRFSRRTELELLSWDKDCLKDQVRHDIGSIHIRQLAGRHGSFKSQGSTPPITSNFAKKCVLAGTGSFSAYFESFSLIGSIFDTTKVVRKVKRTIAEVPLDTKMANASPCKQSVTSVEELYTITKLKSRET